MVCSSETLLRRDRLPVGTRDAQPLHAEVESGPLDSQTFGSPFVARNAAAGFKLSRGGRRTFPEVRMTLRSMKFCSSRTFPGQEWHISASMASLGIHAICLFMRSE